MAMKAFNGCLSVSNLQPKTDLLEFRAIHSVLYDPTNHMSTEDIHVWLVGRLFSLIHTSGLTFIRRSHVHKLEATVVEYMYELSQAIIQSR